MLGAAILLVVAAGPQDASVVFEKLRALEGRWAGRSTKGWDGVKEFRTIARGSAVVVSSSFDDKSAADAGMLSVVHLDLARLLLTHYCEARNQPRLQLTSWNVASQSATFEFLDGTNLKSRNDGHMDKLVIRFVDRDQYEEQWTWYQNGKENWLETIKYTRFGKRRPR